MSLLIQNVKLLDSPDTNETVDVYVREGKIESIGKHLKADAGQIIDGEGKLLIPGLVDIHVHLREPGGEAKETIETGTKAAARGGFTTICAMPNTRPVPDSKENLEKILELIEKNAHVRVLPYASITKQQLGKEMTNISELKQLGALAFTDDGVGVQEARMMYEAMKKAAEVNTSIVAHCEDNSLVYGGVMHDGKRSKELDLPGIPSISESVHIARDVLLAEAAGCHYHVCHVSAKESVRVIRDAKKAGIHVTAEVMPHHLLLNDEDIPSDDANYKMNPPLRSKEDQEALIEGLLDGTIDCIATDHAPHTEEEKQPGFLQAPFGIVGLETAFPLLYTHLVQTGILSLKELVDLLTVKPAKIFNLPYGKLTPGASADLVLMDLEKEKTIQKEAFLSRGKNTPFDGYVVNGWPVLTIAEGKIVWQEV
ncbi:dihydroorotase [Melghiribacillus thermohalophilus]|uniref:Dihydroorotase n=1 Tax=Melghiribacillus thermohalophilus TaxID=1324956 RepID=A0A4R3NCY1_9BACI|nr:dihydroorotase [Melghiribacillus thermohalophilus]TCT26843.1 dihydroorotase [Melghiribacillus thermohalophilus]